MMKSRWWRAARQAGAGAMMLVCALVAACGKKPAPAEKAAGSERRLSGAGQEGVATVYSGGMDESLGGDKRVAAAGGGETQVTDEGGGQRGAEPSVEFLPEGFSTWKQFDESYAKFRAERVAAQESLPVNEDGSRVWLGQVVYADEGLDARIKTHAMARRLVKGAPECVFMRMDGTRVKFAEAGLGEAIGKLAAKKYVKVFGWLDESAGTIRMRYIDIAGEKYVWRDGKLVRE